VSVEEVLDAREALGALQAQSLEQPGTADEDGAPSVLDGFGHPDAAIARAVERAALNAVLETLDARARTIVRLYYQEELTQSEIGRRLGYSQMHISRLLRDAVDQLRLACDADDRQVRARIAAAWRRRQKSRARDMTRRSDGQAQQGRRGHHSFAAPPAAPAKGPTAGARP
jgi:DNA-directed RNA polymerase sigma subunit (sigma70/sigma32)